MKTHAPTRRRKPSEEGYMLVAVIFLVFLLTLSLTVALPKISKEIQRDRELETMNRGKQYIRAIRMYYHTFHAYPPNVDALVKPTNNIRFLRKKYADPTTGKEDWKPVRMGQNKAPTAMGFFGQPMTGSTIGGIGPGAQNTGFNPSTTATTPDPNAQPVDPNNPNGTVDPNNPNGTNGTGTGLNSQTFGGAGIIGFSPNSTKSSIMVYKTKTHYNEWEFVFDPISEQMQQMGINPAGGGGLNGGINGLNNNSGFGNGAGLNNGSGIGNGGGNNSSNGSSTDGGITPQSTSTPQ
jgi:type II secretory pathway pseudopilin PulG